MLAADEKSVMEKGKSLAFDRKKGNCLACHVIKDGVSPGNIGPPLIYMSARYKSKEALHAQIADATVANPNSLMPPFGKHGILSDAEIGKIVEFIYSL
ncbi:sulfur oxidation c-type cytochrome SoxX [Candidatus Venteria ishoeyi]|uniref:sulfur oxidation c-type cytochrome SoxX n=1 Tax=Candidatus Venteria ishoeyi TaxID=1899563 RepID=UPI0025A4D5DE|nr:sulfur oxidation c-type cytochrome SoxX [Candidatus Venteria ishoeyi]MDM8546432.1 sulfur oxidation c-type cytochrome SoxX [Candidatus Venteria ishoeyi]